MIVISLKFSGDLMKGKAKLSNFSGKKDADASLYWTLRIQSVAKQEVRHRAMLVI